MYSILSLKVLIISKIVCTYVAGVSKKGILSGFRNLFPVSASPESLKKIMKLKVISNTDIFIIKSRKLYHTNMGKL